MKDKKDIDISMDVLDLTDSSEDDTLFVAASGTPVKIRAVSPLLLDKIRGSVELPKIPTYTAKTVTGKDEVHPHDESTLETDEDKAAWAEYKQKMAVAQATVNERVMKALFLRGVEVNVSLDDDWVEEQKFIGLEIPTNPVELKLHYIMTEIISSPQDMVTLMTKIMRLTGVDEKVIASAEESFRLAMAGAGGDETDGDSDESGELVA